MTTFDTSSPISVTIDVRAGDVRLVASDRQDTVVDVQPSSPSDRSDVEAAAGTRIELLGDRLHVTSPRPGLLARMLTSASVDVVIAVPSGSSVRASVGLGDVRATGTLGDCQITTGAGHVLLGDTGMLDLRTGDGDVIVGHVAGDATTVTASGATRIASVSGHAAVNTGHGAPRIGTVGGDLRISAGNGDITVESVGGRVDARTAHGAIRIGSVRGHEVDLKTAHGDLEVGIEPGPSAWLDLDTAYGRVHNDLTPTHEPDASGATVRVTARTSYGDIRIRRAAGSAPAH